MTESNSHFGITAQGIITALIAVVLSVIVSFIMDVKSDQAELSTRFEERIVADRKRLRLIEEELRRARNTRTIFRESDAFQKTRIDGLSQLIDGYVERHIELRTRVAANERQLSEDKALINEAVKNIDRIIKVLKLRANNLESVSTPTLEASIDGDH